MQRIFFLFIFLLTSARGQREGETCVDNHSNTTGICTVVDQCVSAENDFIQSRIRPTLCLNNASLLAVCCLDNPNISAELNASGVKDDSRRVSERKCDEYSISLTKKVRPIPLILDQEPPLPNCEYTTGDELTVISRGNNAKPLEFPHMAAIGWADFNGGYQFSCGGTLISPRFVVTAAHCNRNINAQKPEPVIVRLGDQNIDSTVYDGANPIDVPIRRLHQHPDYRRPRVYNDIALAELAFNIKFSSAIRPACLWTKNDLGGHQQVIATGWGVVNLNTKQTAKELQKVSLSILDVDFCNRTLKKLHNRNWAKGFIDSQMCVGDLRGGKGTCQGDSGGPIQVVSKENPCIFHIVGVTSFGKDCGETGLPAVYTRISSYVDWIESIVWPGESRT